MTKALTPGGPQHDAFEAVTRLVLDSLTSENSKNSYRIALRDFLLWFRHTWRGPLSKAAVNAYKTELIVSGKSSATVNVKLAAVRKLALEAADNNLLPNDVAAAISRVKCVRIEGTRTGTWLTKEQAESLLNAPDLTTLYGLRDRAVLAVLIGTGIRREEACTLRFEDIQIRDGRPVILDLRGKGRRIRTIAMPSFTKQAIDEWAREAGISTGIILRQTNSRLLAGKRLCTTSVWKIVQINAAKAGLGGLKPHDLRRTYAKLAHQGGSALEQIQLSLGHSSVRTTEVYVNARQDLSEGNAPCDRLGIGGKPRAPRSKDATTAISRAHGVAPLTPGSLQSYSSAWRDFESYCTAHGLTALPAVPETVALYLADRSHLTPATLKARLTGITKAHSAAGYESPALLRHAAVFDAMEKIRRAKGSSQ